MTSSSSTDEANILYVGNHGTSLGNGKTIKNAFLTYAQAFAVAIANPTIKYSVVNLSKTDYVGGSSILLDVPSNCDLFAPFCSFSQSGNFAIINAKFNSVVVVGDIVHTGASSVITRENTAGNTPTIICNSLSGGNASIYTNSYTSGGINIGGKKLTINNANLTATIGGILDFDTIVSNVASMVSGALCTIYAKTLSGGLTPALFSSTAIVSLNIGKITTAFNLVSANTATVAGTIDALDTTVLNAFEHGITIAGRSNIKTKTANYTLTSSDDVILCNGTFAITLPVISASLVKKNFTIKNIGSGTITISSTDLFEGLTTQSLTAGSSYVITNNNTSYFIL
jgi:hypothetical protein